jgi:hypothetical protein
LRQVDRLFVDGRITDAEYHELRAAILRRHAA